MVCTTYQFPAYKESGRFAKRLSPGRRGWSGLSAWIRKGVRLPWASPKSVGYGAEVDATAMAERRFGELAVWRVHAVGVMTGMARVHTQTHAARSVSTGTEKCSSFRI
jgi:hypothetical protein